MVIVRIKKRTLYRACSYCSNIVVSKGSGERSIVGNRTGVQAKLQIDLTPRPQVQLLYTVKRANLTRLPI